MVYQKDHQMMRLLVEYFIDHKSELKRNPNGERFGSDSIAKMLNLNRQQVRVVLGDLFLAKKLLEEFDVHKEPNEWIYLQTLMSDTRKITKPSKSGIREKAL
jgi:hypothetical protein